jgi:hypothetical protein
LTDFVRFSKLIRHPYHIFPAFDQCSTESRLDETVPAL